MVETASPAGSAAPALQIGGFDADLERLIELWPTLVSDDRAALLAHAEHLVALRDGMTRREGGVKLFGSPLPKPSS